MSTSDTAQQPSLPLETPVSVVLASQSPRRQELLAALGVPFAVAISAVDETAWPDEAPADLALRLARSKARSVAARFPEQIVLGADTIVVLDGVVLGKPADAAEATAMLRRLRGQPHLVMSAVCALRQGDGAEVTALNISRVWMRNYSDEEIAAYVASGDPLDKAGAYAIQSATFAPVARVEGCFSSVMGFPLADVAQVLAALGAPPVGNVVAACRPHAGRCCQER